MELSFDWYHDALGTFDSYVNALCDSLIEKQLTRALENLAVQLVNVLMLICLKEKCYADLLCWEL